MIWDLVSHLSLLHNFAGMDRAGTSKFLSTISSMNVLIVERPLFALGV